MKVTFESTSGTKFIVTGVVTEGASVVNTHFVPTVDDILEFAQFVREERAAMEAGPRVMNGPLLLVNGASLRVEWNDCIPCGAIHFIGSDGKFRKLEGGRGSA